MPSDIHPHPETFSGLVTENPESWLNFLERYNKYKRLSEQEWVDTFGLYLKHSALEWLENLPQATRSSKQRLVEAFKERFYPSDIEKLRSMSDLFRRQQKPFESVDEYFSGMQKVARLAGNVSDQNLRSAILMGLKPELKKHAIQVGPTSLNELLRCAKIAEEANTVADQGDPTLTETLRRIEKKLAVSDHLINDVTPIGDSDAEDVPRSRSASTGRHLTRSSQRDLSPYRASPTRSNNGKQQQVRFDLTTDLTPGYGNVNIDRSQQPYPQQSMQQQPYPQQPPMQQQPYPQQPPMQQQPYPQQPQMQQQFVQPQFVQPQYSQPQFISNPAIQQQYGQQPVFQQTLGAAPTGAGEYYGGATNNNYQGRTRGRSTFYRSNSSYRGRYRGNRGGNQSRLTGDFSDKTCFNCGAQGHISRFCSSRSYNNASFHDSSRQNGIICFNCQQPGHISRDCMMARQPNPDNSS